MNNRRFFIHVSNRLCTRTHYNYRIKSYKMVEFYRFSYIKSAFLVEIHLFWVVN